MKAIPLCLGLLAAQVMPVVAADDRAPTVPPDWVRYESDRGPLLLGRVDEAIILAEDPAWPVELEGWQPEPQTVAALASVDANVEILVVLGTWCEDSQREVPRLWRLLAAADNPQLRLDLVAVGRAADDAARSALASLGFPADYRQDLTIEKVPTIILRHEGAELGRIVETPEVSLDADLAAILRRAELVGQTDSWR